VTKSGGGGSEARKPRSLKSGGLKPSSLIEVYAYEYKSSYLENTVVAFKYFFCVF